MVWTDIFIKRPVLAVVVSLLILLIGFRAATTLPIRQYPKLSNTVVNVTTVYPGASPDLIQGFITTPIEQAVASAEGVDYMTSSSVLGTSTIQVYIKLNFDPNQALDRSPRQGEFGQIPHPEGIQRPDRDQDDRPDHGGDVSRLLQRGAVGIGDLGLSDAGGSAGAVHRRWRRLGRYSGRPDLRDAAVARSGPHGRPQRFAGRRFRRDRRQQFPGGRGPVQGLLHRLQRVGQHRSDRTSISSSA